MKNKHQNLLAWRKSKGCTIDFEISLNLLFKEIAASLGEFGRMGLLITEKYGPRVRLCKVFTDLPLAIDRYRPFGVTEFCKTCEI